MRVPRPLAVAPVARRASKWRSACRSSWRLRDGTNVGSRSSEASASLCWLPVMRCGGPGPRVFYASAVLGGADAAGHRLPSHERSGAGTRGSRPGTTPPSGRSTTEAGATCSRPSGRRSGCEVRSAQTSAPAPAFAETLRAPDARLWRGAGRDRVSGSGPALLSRRAWIRGCQRCRSGSEAGVRTRVPLRRRSRCPAQTWRVVL
jgi:hypothetical protein